MTPRKWTSVPSNNITEHRFLSTPACVKRAMSIRRLPDDVIDKIKSSVIISCLNDVGCGLIKNSLDASATQVDVFVDYAKGNCTIEDNGVGINVEEFRTGGGLGKLHHSSRLPSCGDVHASRGDFLASVATLSLINITSHQAQHVSHNSITFHQGNVISRDTPARLDQRYMTYRHGTRVAVKNLFGSMPVRVKYRSATFIDRADVEKEFRKLVNEVVALLLAWPRSVALTLKETQSRKEVRLRSPGDELSLSTRFSRLIVQSGMLDVLDDRDLVPVMAGANGISIQGYMSKKPLATRRCQMMSIGIRPVANTYGTNVLYEVVNKVFAASDFGLMNVSTAEPWPSQDLAGKVKLRKGAERWPLYCLQISFDEEHNSPWDVAEVLDERGPQIAELERLLALICYRFLQKQHFRPTKPDAIAKRPKKPREFGTDVRHERLSNAIQSNTRNHNSRNGEDPERLLERFRLLNRSISKRDSDENLHSELEVCGDQNTTKKSFRVGTKLARPEPSTWLQNILDSWKNPVFETAGASMARVQTPESSQRGSNVYFESGSMAMHSRVTRAALATARVISQVDRKFILIRIALDEADSDSPTGLFMVDQHAADERCRVERLMKDYFSVDDFHMRANTDALQSPMVLQISSREAEALQRRRKHFSSWGIHYDLTHKQPPTAQTNNDTGSDCEVSIRKLPASIFDRCCAEPQKLASILREEASTDEEYMTYPVTPVTSNALPSFSGCPRGILNLLNSRSCRGAIMFNDELTHSECEDLMSRLSQCSFPFQCAHGRPSMAPLFDLGASNNVGGWLEDYNSNIDVKKWKEWYTHNNPRTDSDMTLD